MSDDATRPARSGDYRNDHRMRIVLTEIGPVEIDVPGARDGSVGR